MTSVVRVGRDGFTGSSITAWCRSCEDFAVFDGRGWCVWCDATIATVARPRVSPRSSLPPAVRGLTEAGVYSAHGAYIGGDRALLDVALDVFVEPGYSGYRTATNLRDALRRAFAARGLPLRSQAEAAQMRWHGRIQDTTDTTRSSEA